MSNFMRVVLPVGMVCLLHGDVFATDCHVPSEYPTIQSAIDACSGGVVIVADGTYTGEGNTGIIIWGSATIRSANGPGSCVIDCGNETYGFFCRNTATIEGFTITRGYSSSHGGAVRNDLGEVTVRNCWILGNAAALWGGGLYCVSDFGAPIATMHVEDCVIAENAAGWYGGGFAAEDEGRVYVTNSTIANNSAGMYGGGLYGYASANFQLTSSIVAANSADGGGDALALEWDSMASLNRSDCFGTMFFTGASWVNWSDGSIDTDPMFADAENGDLHLLPDSPCIDTGHPDVVQGYCDRDMDRAMRVWDGDGDGVSRIDMGADEYGSIRWGDVNCDGSINSFDIDPFVVAMTDPDGYPAAYPDCDIVFADINCDGWVNSFDIDPFVALLTGD